MKTILSGVQTSGSLHLGNYLGAIKNWLKLQNTYECYFFLANLHAITVPQDPVELQKSTLDIAAIYLASGLSPEQSTLFVQSEIPAHAELAWVFNCITPIGWLKRMTQFKDKAGKGQDNASAGLFTYPALMAADILLYKPDLVPVGDDQKQHLELTRDIADAINRKCNRDIFTLPQPYIQGATTRVMSLRNGLKKMSKSDESDASRINMLDEPDLIRKKIGRAKTDSFEHISYEDSRPEISNLIDIFSAITGNTVEDIVQNYANAGFAKFKQDLADVVVNCLLPIQEEFHRIRSDLGFLRNILAKGNAKAQERAQKTCQEVKQAFGLSVVK